MATVTVDQAKLVLNAFASVFQNNLTSAEAVTWKQYDTEMNDRNSLTVSEQVGPRYAVNTTTSGVADLTSGVQDSVFGSEQFTVNKTFNTSMGWGDFVKIRDIGDARESTAIRNAATNLAESIDQYILGVAQKASNNWLGTPANGVSTWTDFVQGYTRLKEEGVDDSELRGILTFADKQALGGSVLGYAAPDALVTGAYRQGFTGEIGGLPVMFTQQLPALTTGTRTNGAVNGANQNSNYRSVAVSAAPGHYLTQTIAADGFGANATIKAGEAFTIANVYAYDNRAQVVRSNLQQFTVIADATADGTGAVAALRIFPAIVVPATGLGGDVHANTAHATCGTVPADNAVITWVGSANTAYKPRFIIQKEAIQVNTAPLIMPATGHAMNKSLTKFPLTVRMWQHSDFNTGNHSVRFDVALTANVRDRRRIVRINGN